MSGPDAGHRVGQSRAHVAVFLPSLGGGGAERAMVTLVNEFAAAGVSVDLVLARRSGTYLSSVASSVRIVDLGGNRVFASLHRLMRYLRREHPPALLSALNHANLVAIWAARLAAPATRVVVSERATLSLIHRQAAGIRQRALPILMRLSYPLAHRVIAVSRGVADDLCDAIGLSNDRVDVIYNPVVTETLLSLSREPPDHHWLVGERRAPVLLAVGRLAPEKGFDVLMHAFAALRSEREVRLIVLGEGPSREALLKLAHDLGIERDVDLPGFSANPFACMRACDVFVLSSRAEGLPGVLIEAMACGARVVSTDCPSGPDEILEGGKWGDLVPVDDPHALARAIAGALDRPDPPKTAQRAARFDVRSSVDAYLNALGLARKS